MLAIHIYCSEEAIEYILQEGWGMASLRQQQQAGLHAGYPSFQRHQRFAEPCCARFRFGQQAVSARIVPAQPHLRACFMGCVGLRQVL